MSDLDLIDPEDPYASATSYALAPTPQRTNYGQGLMYASMGISAIASLTTAFSQSASARARGEYEASVARTNATLARLQAKQTLEVGDVEAARINQKNRQIEGSILAAQGASGVSVSSGSAALVRNAVRNAGAFDELTVRNNAARRAWGFETEAIQGKSKSDFAIQESKAKAHQTLVVGGLEAISGPLSIYSRYTRRSQGGIYTNPFPDVED